VEARKKWETHKSLMDKDLRLKSYSRVLATTIGIGFAKMKTQGAAPDDAIGHRASRRCTFAES
jgi:hypothetical protein